MPEEFDPAWEYYEPDPYVAWVFARSGQASGFDAVFDGRMHKFGSVGMRFGSGDPNKIPVLRLGKEKIDRRVHNCGQGLLPKNCVHCGRVFRPARSTRVYCSPSCKQRSQVKPARPKAPKVATPVKIDRTKRMQIFLAMYKSGVRMADIAREVGISLATAQKWRRRQGLAPRGPRGKPSAPGDAVSGPGKRPAAPAARAGASPKGRKGRRI